ncbi:hypothetical protein NLM24_22545 [Nocardia zapadnayensis]|uniref:hypothetical protein n=1 Tax=Nocardia rhamnosiphila TaxID=426716 RepID=UPI002246E7BB|nr:hypothetical protein [Nocardia zapadnayensis]MCX0273420.1 hypothetical protein [Nocardia zapadnayensis]
MLHHVQIACPSGGEESMRAFCHGAGQLPLHWHIAPLPPGVPYREQQLHALMAENGVLAWTLADAVDLAGRLRRALNS